MNDPRKTENLPLWTATLLLPLCGTLFAGLAAAQPEKKDQRALVVAVRGLPEQFAPATAWTNAEKQALPLLFEGLVEPTGATLGARYRPGVALDIPAGDGLQTRVRLRPDAKWSDGAAVTAADVRHTYTLLSGAAPIWKEFFELPRLESPAELTWTNRQGLFDPLFALTHYVVPQQYRGKPLSAAADAEFARAPVGSGPFQYAGREKHDGRETAVLRRNAHAPPPQTAKPITEIRFVAWKDADKDLPGLAPHVVLDATGREAASLRAGRYAVLGALPPRVHVLALNHRQPAFAHVALRRALALALDRTELIKSLNSGEGAAVAVPANGPFPARSWAIAPPPRVPATLDQPELARSLAKEVASKVGAVNIALSFSDATHADACAAIARQWTTMFEAAGVQATVKPVAMAPQAHRAALRKGDFDVAVCTIEEADAILPLSLLFDPHPDARKPGGANILGYANDAKLQSLLSAVHAHRQFSVRRGLVHDLHAHLVDTMPFIPLWQAPLHVALSPKVTAPEFDPRRVFADIDRWTVE